MIPHSVVALFNEKNEFLLEERSDDGYFVFPAFKRKIEFCETIYSRGLIMDYLKRKIDKFLDEWLISDKKKPLIPIAFFVKKKKS